jgi:hypothetical protein
MTNSWFWSDGFYKVFCPNRTIAGQIGRWVDCQRHCVYYRSDGLTAEDVIVPKRLLNKAKSHIKQAETII